MEKAPTLLQTEVLKFINRFREREQYNPSYSEIASHFGWSSPTSAYSHVKALEKRGVLSFRGKSGFRGYVVNDKFKEKR